MPAFEVSPASHASACWLQPPKTSRRSPWRSPSHPDQPWH